MKISSIIFKKNAFKFILIKLEDDGAPCPTILLTGNADMARGCWIQAGDEKDDPKGNDFFIAWLPLLPGNGFDANCEDLTHVDTVKASHGYKTWGRLEESVAGGNSHPAFAGPQFVLNCSALSDNPKSFSEFAL